MQKHWRNNFVEKVGLIGRDFMVYGLYNRNECNL